MSDGPLPHTVNTRKAVTRGASYRGVLGARELASLADVLPDEKDDTVHAEIVFSRDDEGRQVVGVELHAGVTLVCQRCLERFRQEIDSRSTLAIVRTDEEAKQLPPRYEPLIGGEELDLWNIVGEELALILPVAPLHLPGDCPVTLPQAVAGDAAAQESARGQETGSGGDADRPNPFEVLSALLDSEQDKS